VQGSGLCFFGGGGLSICLLIELIAQHALAWSVLVLVNRGYVTCQTAL
jgi:hypothetical protein